MKVEHLGEFRERVAQKPSVSLVLVVGEDEGEREEARKLLAAAVGAPVQHCTDVATLAYECASHSLFSSPRCLYLADVERLGEEENKALQEILAVDFADPCLCVCLDAKIVRGALVSLVERRGLVYQIGSEKGKEGRLLEQLCATAAQQGLACSGEGARALLMAVGPHPQLLMRELEKVMCYVGERREITAADVRAVTLVTPQQTLWQLADALFAKEGKVALQVLQGLLQEQVVPLVMIAALRTQTESALQMLSLCEKGGADAVRAQFPYLRGGLYDKKMTLLRRCGRAHLEKLHDRLFQAECAWKNQQTPWPLEKLIIELT